MPGLMELLGGLNNPQTTQADQFNMDIAKQLLDPKNRVLQPIGPDPYKATHWTQGVADMLRAIAGTNMANNLDRSRDRRQNLDAPRVVGPSQPNLPPSTSGRVNQLRPTNSNQFNGALPPGFSEAPNGQGADRNVAPAIGPDVNNRRLPRSIRTNNPGAIEDGRFAQANGAIGNDGRYATFATMEDGYRAQEALLSSYINRGFNTVEKIVGRWAPANVDNNSTSTYTTNVARALGIRPNETVPLERVGELAEAMAAYEAGRPVPRQRDTRMALGGPLPQNTNEPNSDVTQVADRAPQDNPPVQRDVNNQPVTRQMGPGGHPIFNPDTDFQPTFPDPPPHNWGLTPDQLRSLNFQSPEARKMIVDGLVQQWTPQYTEMHGGKRWIVPATGQSGFIPDPKYGKLETQGGSIDTVTIYDRYGRRNTYVLDPTGQSTSTNAPAAPAVNPPAAPNPAPVAPPAAVTPPAATEPNAEPVAPAAPPAPIQNAPTLNNIPPLANPPPAPPAARKSWLRGPDFVEGRQIAREEEEKKVSLTARAAAREEPIKQAIEVGNEASRTQAVVDQLRELENLPGLNRLPTGPGAETILNARTGINMALKAAGLPEWDAEMVAAGEALRKLNTILGSVGARQLTNRPTQFDFQAFLKANPGMLVSAQGRRFLTEILGQMSARDVELGNAASAYRGRAEDWPKVRDEILLRHRPIINGNVLDSTMSNSRFDAATGQLIFDRPVRGQIVGNPQGESFQFIGRTGNNQDGRNPSLWIKVDPRKPETWRFPEMETPARK